MVFEHGDYEVAFLELLFCGWRIYLGLLLKRLYGHEKRLGEHS